MTVARSGARKTLRSAAAGAGGRAPGKAATQGWEMHCWCLSILKCSRSSLFGSKVILVAVASPLPAPHAQRMKSAAWTAAVVM